MKQLTCEMCGSTDLVKQDGVFVCQSCGTKYSIEEAKKMMVEGTVDVSGSTVKIDTSDELENLYQIARRAKNEKNAENAAKYYDMILVKDPTSWEAAFYTVYFRAMQCKIAEIQSAAISIQNCLKNVLMLIHDHVSPDQQEPCVGEVASYCMQIAYQLISAAKQNYDNTPANIKNDYTQEYVNNVCAARDMLYLCGTQIESVFSNNDSIMYSAAVLWEHGISYHEELLPYLSNPVGNQQVMIQYAMKIKEYDPDFTQAFFEGLEQKAEAENMRLQAKIKEVKEKEKEKEKKRTNDFIPTAIFGLVFGFLAIYAGFSFMQSIKSICIAVGVIFIAWGGISLAIYKKRKSKEKEK